MFESSKIIVGGCSFTDKSVPRLSAKQNDPVRFRLYEEKGFIGDWPMWPDIVGEHFDCEVINNASCGNGNERIFLETVKNLMDCNPKEIKFVIVGWSEFQRTTYLTKNGWVNDVPDTINNRWARYAPNIRELCVQQTSYMYALQQVCKSLGVTLYQFQMLRPFAFKYTGEPNHPNYRTVASFFARFPKENVENFFNWPPIDILGNDVMHDIVFEQLKARQFDVEQMYYARDDRHFLWDGQKQIAENVIKEIECLTE